MEERGRKEEQMSEREKIVETYQVDPYQGVVAAMLALRKPGYTIVKVDRKGRRAKVTYQKEE